MKELPPPTFALSQPVFRPIPPDKVTPGLAEQIRKLGEEGRLRTALDVLLPRLTDNPADQEALWLAMLTLGFSRTQQVQALEPLGERFLLDRRLDPLFAVCSHCRITTWVPSNCLAPAARLNVMNPGGMQCRNCGYVVCRNCFQSVHVAIDVDFLSQQCPNCGKMELGVPVYPTGRLPMQLDRGPTRVSTVVVFREGPVPPDRDYIAALLDARSPDAIDDKADLLGIPVFSWPDDIEVQARATLDRLGREGRISTLSLSDATTALLLDDESLHVYVVKMFRRRLK